MFAALHGKVRERGMCTSIDVYKYRCVCVCVCVCVSANACVCTDMLPCQRYHFL